MARRSVRRGARRGFARHDELIYAAPIVSEQFDVPWVSYELAPLSYLSTCDPQCSQGHGVDRCGCDSALDFSRDPCGGPTRHAIVVEARARTTPRARPARPLAIPCSPKNDSPRLDLALFSSCCSRRSRIGRGKPCKRGFLFFDEDHARTNWPTGS